MFKTGNKILHAKFGNPKREGEVFFHGLMLGILLTGILLLLMATYQMNQTIQDTSEILDKYLDKGIAAPNSGN